MESMSLDARYRGALIGLACGDAVGTTVEFMPRGTFPPVTDMQGAHSGLGVERKGRYR
jgi:ADP-ribosyl-[dinitrogen reductase] hydrolase